MSRDLSTVGSVTTHSVTKDQVRPHEVDRAFTLGSPLWMPTSLNQGYMREPQRNSDLTLRQQMQDLGSTLLKINDWVQERLPVSLTTPTHLYKPGGAIWVKEWNVQRLKPHWRGTFVVILSTPTTVKVAEIVLWIHHSQVKPASVK
jgi:hypothetical protein